PRNIQFGDLSTNISMQLTKSLGIPPLSIAEKICSRLINPGFEYSFIKPGFINIRFKDDYIFSSLLEIIASGAGFFSTDLGSGSRVQLEFISANPTGPLNIVNARAAAVGDVLGRLFRRFGYYVENEYYINDAGNQVELLAKSVELAITGGREKRDEFPEDYYCGDYIFTIADTLKDGYNALPSSERFDFIRDRSLEYILQNQRDSVKRYGVEFNSWFSEKALSSEGKQEEALNILRDKDLIYDKDGAVWIKTTELGDSQDWVLIKSDGSYTYLMGDIAYHLNKFERGFSKAINLWGPDHQAGVTRLKAALTAFGIPRDWLEVLIIQQVNLIRGGEKLKVSKRKGIFETLDRLIEEVGTDGARFTFLLRTVSSHLDFDIDLVKEQKSENPVFYIQYMHARLSSIFRKASEDGINFNPTSLIPEQIVNDETRDLFRKVFEYPLVLYSALNSREPSRLTNFAMELSDSFHSFYHQYRIITENPAETNSRLVICKVMQVIIRDILELTGVTAPDKM
ncbi:MAG TPA: arginine--tRNA ligase, partial [Firmicutes bacterium]|nr:arginine--tRNA ligase [Bacillota bacterium]